MPLKDRHVVLGVSGSIAAFKAADLCSKLVQAGALVDVVLTAAAQQFVTPFTFRSLTGRPVYTNMFEPATDAGEEHVALARRADLIVVAPATATTLARFAQISSCSTAAARNVSAAQINGCWPSLFKRFASFPTVVVLPVPFTPTIKVT